MPKKAGTGSSWLDRSPTHLLHRVAQCAGDIFHQAGELTPRQLTVLITVADNEGLSQTEISQRTNIDHTTLADVVRRLGRKGLLVRRRTKEDGRAYAVTLTDQGRRALRAAEPVGKKSINKFSLRFCRMIENFIGKLQSLITSLQTRRVTE